MPDTAPTLTDEEVRLSYACAYAWRTDDDIEGGERDLSDVRARKGADFERWLAAVIARAKREARDGMANDLALIIDQECPHEPDEHADGTCEVCDYAFAMSQMVRDYAEAANHA